MKRIDVITMKVSGKDRFGLVFPYDADLMKLIKQIPGACWSKDNQCWHIAMTQANLNRVIKETGKNAVINMTAIKKGITQSSSSSYLVLGPLLERDRENLKKFENHMSFRRYSLSTLRTYMQIMNTFLRFRDPDAEVSNLKSEVIRFTNEYILQKSLSFSYHNQFMNALRLFYREIENRQVEVESISRPRREHRLPNVLSQQEISAMLKATRNLKHKTMLSLIYACGLRRGELLSLLPTDIERDREVLIIRMAKGNRDRIVPLPKAIIASLEIYYKDYRPKVWLFEGAKPGEKYDERSLQQIGRASCRERV